MKKILLLLFLLVSFHCFANDHFTLYYQDGTSKYYEAEYSSTSFEIHTGTHNKWIRIGDNNFFEESKKHTYEDYDIINSSYPDVISYYKNNGDGYAIIEFYKSKVKLDYQPNNR